MNYLTTIIVLRILFETVSATSNFFFINYYILYLKQIIIPLDFFHPESDETCPLFINDSGQPINNKL